MYWKKIGQLSAAPMNKAPVVSTLAAVLPIHGPPRPAISAAMIGRKTMRRIGCIRQPAPRRRPASSPVERNRAGAPPGPRPSPGNQEERAASAVHPVHIVDRNRAAAAEEDDEDCEPDRGFGGGDGEDEHR